MNALCMLAVCAAALAVSCSDSHPKNHQGGETHFLKACIDDACGDGLECVCGVCTQTCQTHRECGSLDPNAACIALDSSSAICEGEVPEGRVCDVRCTTSAECEELGDGLECVEQRCRPEEIAMQLAGAADAGEDAGSDAAVDAATGDITDPLVLLVIDTSGSMERKTKCTCTSASCSECLPHCTAQASDKNRWAQLLEALTGTFEDFSCEERPRASFTGQYDQSYPLPHFEPKGTQRTDGVLDMFADRVRFGLATFDGVGSYDRDEQRSLDEFSIEQSAGIDGMWSYPPDADWTEVGSGAAPYQVYRYPGCPHPYVMNTGIRGRNAESGALVVDTGETSRAAVVDTIRASLLATRPYGGTPIAAALDDVRALFEHDPLMAAERAMPDHPRHVVLITDGRPDDDYRNVNCDCNELDSGKNCARYLLPVEQASDMRCPYPKPEHAARALRCGTSDDCAEGSADAVHVIGLDVGDDSVARAQIKDIAARGGGRATFANNTNQLRIALTRVMQGILSEPQTQPMLGDTCSVGEYVYADGARWPERCASCECVGGLVQCTGDGDCRRCDRDWDCSEGELCNAGACTGMTSPACDKPTNFDAFCGADGLTYSDPCATRTPIRHGGACVASSCVWLGGTIEHGESFSVSPCESCMCFEGILECSDDFCGEPCSSTLPCRDDEICVLPIDQCVASEEETGRCERVPVHCSGMNEVDRELCGCDGNLYSECELLLNRQNKASTCD